MKRNKLLTGFLVLGLGLSLVACSSNEPEEKVEEKKIEETKAAEEKEEKVKEEKKEEEKEEQDRPLVAGCTRALADMVKDTQAAKELTFDDFDYGLTRLSYADNVEIVESYLPADQIQSCPMQKIF